ncbi:fungal specific transcription factor domain-containing protein 30 [Elsinoe australis]|uniref:Fungal specific transcription factor domain-containing protein 30 n=1 Tax=Elsinoe australis TaxID=40998 RepID=A0A4U7B3I5_9PEZI|nr:fungal specific transcription factor domain-containing protein 30 [Elsinoe australis]
MPTSGTNLEYRDETPALLQEYRGYVAVSPAVQNHDPAPPPQSSPGSLSERHASEGSTEQVTALPVHKKHVVTDREALLLGSFANNMAKWADITDDNKHFEREVPLKALSEPVLRYAICAFSSRHLHRHAEPSNETESIVYQDKCLSLLIPAISQAEHKINDVILTSVAILRQCEEMNDDDKLHHLTGTTHLLSLMSTQPLNSGLSEAAAWLCLREDIYVSLTTQTPLRTDVAPFLHSATITHADDTGWACRAVLLLARLLTLAFSPSLPHQADHIRSLEKELEHWNLTKPDSFNPMWHVSRDDSGVGRGLPSLWMVAPHHALGLQYYYIAKLVLASRRVAGRGGEEVEERGDERVQIRHDLRMVLGLAVSNPHAENLWFTARHCLAVWGGSLAGHVDRQAALVFLAEMEERTGWRTLGLRESLKVGWEGEVV